MDATPSSNPYPGLRSFQAEETYLFFGRDEQRIELLHRLRRSRFLAIVGTSGSGKSSLVRAGLLPGLHGGFMAGQAARWRIADLRPGTDPIGSLARALDAPGVLRDSARAEDEPSFTEATLRRSGVGLVEAVREARLPTSERLLVLVDQFEEVFRGLESDDSPRANDDAVAFVRLLLEASRGDLPIYLVLTMRSDFLGECSRFRDLPEAINDGQYLVPRLTPDQRTDAIVGPAAVFGTTLSSTLLNRLLNDVGENPDQLPILQHALMRTWDHWRSRAANPSVPRVLELEDYEAIGGMGRALSLHADTVFAGLAPEGSPQDLARRQLVAERMFKCLATVGAGGLAVRRLATLQEIVDVSGAPLAEVVAVVEAFRAPSQSFLMPPAGEPLSPGRHVDISHESLMRNWRRMRGWVQEEAESARVYERLSATALLHAKGEAALWDQPDLGVALQWQKVQQPNSAWARRYNLVFDESMAFLRASRMRVEAAEDATARRRRLWIFTTAMVFFAMITGILSWWRDEAAVVDYAISSSQNARVQLQGLRDGFDVYRAHERGATSPVRERFCTRTFARTEREDLFRLLCERDRALSGAERQKVQLYENLLEGRWSDGWDALTAMGRTNLSEDVLGLLAELSRMRSRSDDADRNLLLELKAQAGEFSERQRALANAVAHPVHRRIAEVLIAHPDTNYTSFLNVLEYRTLDAYAEAQKARGATVFSAGARDNGRLVEAELRTLPGGNAYAELVAAALVPESQAIQNIKAGRNYVADHLLELAVFALWPAWRLRRFVQRRRRAVIEPRPHPLRQVAADVLDLAIAYHLAGFVDIFGRAAGGLGGSLLGIAINGDRITAIGLVAGMLAASAYLFWRDALKLRFCRSLGKAWLDLRPIVVDSADAGAITLRTSMRRNPVGGSFVLLAIPLYALFSYTFDTSKMGWFDLAFSAYFAVIGVAVLFLLVDIGRNWSRNRATLTDRWSKTRVIDADSAEALAVRP